MRQNGALIQIISSSDTMDMLTAPITHRTDQAANGGTTPHRNAAPSKKDRCQTRRTNLSKRCGCTHWSFSVRITRSTISFCCGRWGVMNSAGSTGRCNTLLKILSRLKIAQSLPSTLLQLQGDGIQCFLCMPTEVRLLKKYFRQQAIGLVGATLPRTTGVTEVNGHVGLQR